MTAEPSPTAAATRAIDAWFRSPTANTRGREVSHTRGGRASGYGAGRVITGRYVKPLMTVSVPGAKVMA